MEHIRYRAKDAADLVIRPLDELSLIYHRPSGITHIVASPVPEILGAMKDDDLDPGELLERLSQLYEFGMHSDLPAVIHARLEELASLGLIERL
ncbi:HPr-rel-A system PqqD family peptide chaperone [Rhizorhapis suberifaciens]|uniref:PqqD family protein of HPr-rel-A system n=1 Tax=Rhizorhapis suberifaciens TaxID=13656 RepID=A0A840HUH8_9SPHN|nr:HPr-rel-A system PqqD family peptide chaperone [Rhizorhapis suberifaciens]MBB4641675.1 PqqD family protein of HPr-rel-A system [Rhizorhapis suberifaciens]